MDAYRYAESGKHPPYERLYLAYIERFGVKAVFGRDVLSLGEIQRMLIVDDVVNAYRMRKATKNWAEWAERDPYSANLIADIEKELHAND